MGFEWLFGPVEHADGWLTALFEGQPLLVALLIALLLGLRHASDPDHVLAVTSLMASEDADTRAAARLGAWWGAGHAATLLMVGAPLIVLESGLPPWLESGAERAVGAVIVVLALRMLFRWARGHRTTVRSPRQALGIGVLHGLAGTGAVVLLLIAALPTRGQAVAALAVFAPMSAVSMALCSGGVAWTLTRERVEPLYRTVVIPALGTFGVLFGLWYAGLA
ncbi:MAG TPA: hypothetical protein VFY44_11095 [Thermoleophilaceae bacterium]|nr:hypothetical protein [Thermoleophilaceae bacterium]